MRPKRFQVTTPFVILILSLTLLAFAGCGGGSGAGGTASVTIRVGAEPAATGSPAAAPAIPASIAALRFTIGGSGMEAIVRGVSAAGRTVIVETFNVPKGLARTFTIEAFDAAGRLRYRGTATIDVLVDVLSFPITMQVAAGNPAFDRWTWRNPLPSADSMTAVAFGDGVFVAVGSFAAAVSTDGGASFTARTSGVPSAQAIAFGGGVFVAVGPGGLVARSLDHGATWTIGDAGVSVDLRGVAFGNGTFVAVGDGGTILSSADSGGTWTARVSGTADGIARAAFGNGAFVVAGTASATGSAFVLRSADNGTSWSGAAVPPGIQGIGPIAFGNGRFVAPAGVEGGQPIVSTDSGLNWTESTMPLGLHEAIAFGNQAFVVLDSDGTALVANDNGTGWTTARSFTTNVPTGIAFGGGTFVGVANSGEIGTSTTGAAWTPVGSGRVDASLLGIAGGLGRLVAVGSSPFSPSSVPPSVAYYSPDGGATWSAGASGTAAAMRRAAFGDNAFVAVGIGGAIRTSADGAAWTGRTSGTTMDLFGIAFGNATFVAVGSTGAVSVSGDGGASWSASVVSGATEFRAVAFGNGTFVAVGSGAATGVWTSTDGGANWTPIAGSPNFVNTVTFGGGAFVAVGSTGATFVSTDNGATWNAGGTILLGAESSVTSVAYGGGAFAAATTDGAVAFSTDRGATWTSRGIAPRFLADIAYANGAFVVVGDQVSILQSDPL